MTAGALLQKNNNWRTKNMKEKYVVPNMDIIAIESEDVIMASDGTKDSTSFEPVTEGGENRSSEDILGF